MALSPESAMVADETPKEGVRPLRILIAEDGANAANILALFFELEGHEVFVAYDGLQAVNQADAHSPDLVIMDIGMPVLDGVEAARQMRQAPNGHRPVIVALSGLEEAAARHRFCGVSVDRHLSKPVCPSDLRLLIEEIRPTVEARAAI